MIEKSITQRWRYSVKNVLAKVTTRLAGKQESGVSAATAATLSSEEFKNGKNMKQAIIAYMRDLFRSRTLLEVVSKELADAQLEKLNAERSVEYAQSLVSYNEKRIVRLNKRLAEYSATQE